MIITANTSDDGINQDFKIEDDHPIALLLARPGVKEVIILMEADTISYTQAQVTDSGAEK